MNSNRHKLICKDETHPRYCCVSHLLRVSGLASTLRAPPGGVDLGVSARARGFRFPRTSGRSARAPARPRLFPRAAHWAAGFPPRAPRATGLPPPRLGPTPSASDGTPTAACARYVCGTLKCVMCVWSWSVYVSGLSTLQTRCSIWGGLCLI